MTTQIELQKQAQKQNDIIFDNCFVDASKCEVCGCPNLKYIERPNGVLSECPACEAYLKGVAS